MARKSRRENGAGSTTTVIRSVAEDSGIYKTAAYVRLSSEDERKIASESVENQIAFLKAFIRGKEDLELEEVYVDRGETGTKFDRPGFNRMIEDMRAGRFGCIVVKDLSRLGRNYIEAGDYIEKIFPFFGIRFIAVTDGYDSLTASSAEEGLMVPLKNLINEAYAKDISKKICSALEAMMKDGKFVGSMAPYGYLIDPDDRHHLVVDEEVRDVVKLIYQSRVDGMSNIAIARMLNEKGILSPMDYKLSKGFIKSERYRGVKWNAGVIDRILKSVVYIGDLETRKTSMALYLGKKNQKNDKKQRYYFRDAHEAVIDRETFEKVQLLLAEAREKTLSCRGKHEELGRRPNIYLGIIFCGDCGKVMSHIRRVIKTNTGYTATYYFACGASRNLGGKVESGKYIGESFMDETISNCLKSHIAQYLEIVGEIRMLNRTEKVKAIRADVQKQIEDAKKKLSDIRGVSAELYDDFTEGILNEEEYLFAKEKYCEEINRLNERLGCLDRKLSTYDDNFSGGRELADACRKYRDFGTLTEELVKTFIRRIECYERPRVEVQYVFENELAELQGLLQVRREEAGCSQ